VRLFDDDGNEVTGIDSDHLFVRRPACSPTTTSGTTSTRPTCGQFHAGRSLPHEEGFYFICDRKKDMIISGGMHLPGRDRGGAGGQPYIYGRPSSASRRGVGRDRARRGGREAGLVAHG
jgi:hypothetical protein